MTARRPWASVNFVTAHDGFTLMDLVSYNDKHNEANGEDNRDGHSHNLSWNCGVEGETDDAEIIALRDRQRRNLMATLLLSQGTPMILMGDERAGPRAATTTPIARTTRSPGWTGGRRPRDEAFEASYAASSISARAAGCCWRTASSTRPTGRAGAAMRGGCGRDGRRDGAGDWDDDDLRVRSVLLRHESGVTRSTSDERGPRAGRVPAARRPVAALAAARGHRCRGRGSEPEAPFGAKVRSTCPLALSSSRDAVHG